MGEKIEGDGIGADGNNGVGVILETATGVDVGNIAMEVSEALMIADTELILERGGVGVDITREGIVTGLEGEVNVVSCVMEVDVGVLDKVGIWLVSVKGSSVKKSSPEPKSGNIVVVAKISVLLLTISLVAL